MGLSSVERRHRARSLPEIPCSRIHIKPRGTTTFSKIDSVRKYHQILVVLQDVEKTTITTSFGLFEFRRMAFGLRDAAQTFQRFMDQVLSRLHFVYCYIDDLLVASSSSKEKKQRVRQLFTRVWEYGLLTNSDKYFLGHRIYKTGTRPLEKNLSHL